MEPLHGGLQKGRAIYDRQLNSRKDEAGAELGRSTASGCSQGPSIQRVDGASVLCTHEACTGRDGAFEFSQPPHCKEAGRKTEPFVTVDLKSRDGAFACT